MVENVKKSINKSLLNESDSDIIGIVSSGVIVEILCQNITRNETLHQSVCIIRSVFGGKHCELFTGIELLRHWPSQWRHNWRDGVSNHQPYDCLLNRLFRRRSKKTSKLRITGLCARNSPVTGESPAQMAGNRKCFHLMTSSWIETRGVSFPSCNPCGPRWHF